MAKSINLTSTAELSKAQLDQIVKGVAALAKEKNTFAKKKLEKEIKYES